jgi:hypothetical protein
MPMLQELNNGVCYEEAGQKVLRVSTISLVIFHLSFLIFHVNASSPSYLQSAIDER